MGINMTVGRMKEIGERGFNIERLLNIRLGITGEQDSLPARLTDEMQIEGDPKTHVPLKEMKEEYYAIRGWDKTGIPTEKKKKALSLH